MENKKILIGTGIGILAIIAIVAVVLISGCVEEKRITEEQAIAIANATEEVQGFLKLYQDANVDVEVVEVGGCEFIAETTGEYIKCTQEIDKKKGLIVVYWVGEYWKPRYSTAVKIGIDTETGKIVSKYPKLEYIKSGVYCETDEECNSTCSSCGCACINFINYDWDIYYLKEEACPVPIGTTIDPVECKCVNHICVIVNQSN